MSLDRAKLAKVLALLDSDQPGERAAAMEAATRILRQGRARWADLALAGATATTEQLAQAIRTAQAWQQRAEGAQRAVQTYRDARDSLERQNRALARRLTDAEARLEIAAAENAKLRRALGPQKAAAAVFDGMPAADAVRNAAAALTPAEVGALRGALAAEDWPEAKRLVERFVAEHRGT
jgi:hypothetical protein